MSNIELKHLTHSFQDGENIRTILKDVSLSFETGKFYTILGASGSGKTTLLSLISALDEPTQGEILFDGINIKKIGLEAYRRNKISIIFQAYNLVPYMSALENVQIPMAITDNPMPKDKREVALNLLDYLGITRSKATRIVNTLSGGEQQRVAIARALASNVDVILADEPTGNLDETLEDEMIEIFQNLAHHHQKCVIMVTHNANIAKASDQAYTLKKGVLIPHE